MKTLQISAKTALFGPSGLVRLAVKYGGAWHHLSHDSSHDGRTVMPIEVADDVRHVPVFAKIMGPPFATIEIMAILPSHHELTAIHYTIPAGLAHTWIEQSGDFEW